MTTNAVVDNIALILQGTILAYASARVIDGGIVLFHIAVNIF